MAHYTHDDQIVGWGPAVEEINALSSLFEEIIHIGCLHEGPAPKSSLPYENERIRLIGIPPAGGKDIKDKLGILKLIPLYLKTIFKELPKADAVHVRCPANIPLLAIILLSFVRKPTFRWVKYAGNWQPEGGESWSYKFQRWWLNKGYHRGVVTINGKWEGQPEYVYSFLNPCLKSEEILQTEGLIAGKELMAPYRFLFVGAVAEYKGMGKALSIAKIMKERSTNFFFEVIGDSPERSQFEEWCNMNGLKENVRFLGWIPKNRLSSHYEKAHFLLFPTNSEGWAKVLSEAMAYGVVPITSSVSSIPQILSAIGAGSALPPNDIDAFIKSINEYLRAPMKWKAESLAGMRAAHLFTYEHYLKAVKELFRNEWGINL